MYTITYGMQIIILDTRRTNFKEGREAASINGEEEGAAAVDEGQIEGQEQKD